MASRFDGGSMNGGDAVPPASAGAGATRRWSAPASFCAAARVRRKPVAYTVSTAADPMATRLFATRLLPPVRTA
jgi:hypothetical protein